MGVMPHAETFFVNTNHANFTKDYNGNVGSRLGATEWTGTFTQNPHNQGIIFQKNFREFRVMLFTQHIPSDAINQQYII